MLRRSHSHASSWCMFFCCHWDCYCSQCCMFTCFAALDQPDLFIAAPTIALIVSIQDNFSKILSSSCSSSRCSLSSPLLPPQHWVPRQGPVRIFSRDRHGTSYHCSNCSNTSQARSRLSQP